MTQNISEKTDGEKRFGNGPVKISKLSVLIPVYNSEETIENLVDQVVSELRSYVSALEIILVNDGSADDSYACTIRAAQRYPGVVKSIQLARNFGEHNAVMCGLNYVTGNCVAIIDDDFQNPPSEILRLVEKLCEGYDVVYSYYAKKHHSWFRRLGSAFNDWVATRLLNKPDDLYLSSFKVMNASLVRNLIEYQGPYPYIDGIILRSTRRIGRQLCKHESRKAGRSGYTIGKLMHLWLNMFTGFSITPLRIASFIGLFMSLSALFLIVFFIISRLTGGIIIKQEIPAGWASLIITVTFFAGLQLCVLGLIGEYLGRLFFTVNRLPQFVVREVYGLDKDTEKNDEQQLSRQEDPYSWRTGVYRK
jgi:undecaprenyl-phosphate 4-deoxy-4-formamido-L-arabinose transferase